MMLMENIRLAMRSIKQAKLRSFLTMLGLIIGIGSVVAVISVGEGVKAEITNQVTNIGTNLISVTPGNLDEGFDPTAFGASTLTKKDLEDVQDIDVIKSATAIMIINGKPSREGGTSNALTMGTTAEYTEVINQKIEKGRSFDNMTPHNEAVLGTVAARELFDEQNPIGQLITIRNQEFEVVGILEEYEVGFNLGGFDYNNTAYIHLNAAINLTNGAGNIGEIDATAISAEKVDEAVEKVNEVILENHGGVDDFSVIKQEDAVKLFNNIFNVVTSFIAAIAAISLLVGGVGIMNIMLVSVTERTREIGIRKAVGANNRHILTQFLIEAIAVSIIGGLLGVAFAYGIGLLVKIFAGITPVITLSAIILAVGVSTFVGLVFGIWPAWKAARKNPIDALRYE